jgi:hypothetical protein
VGGAWSMLMQVCVIVPTLRAAVQHDARARDAAVPATDGAGRERTFYLELVPYLNGFAV